ncbi:MAG: hypothetical protein ABSG02_08915 [Terriglobales bacterium]|jgi:hypothetical protein
MKSTSSPPQVVCGVVLGIMLQAIPPLLLFRYWQLHAIPGKGPGWEGLAGMGLALAAVLSVGMWQVITILPAALLILPTGKHGVVRGLLYIGTFLALGNIAIILRIYIAYHRVTF